MHRTGILRIRRSVEPLRVNHLVELLAEQLVGFVAEDLRGRAVDQRASPFGVRARI